MSLECFAELPKVQSIYLLLLICNKQSMVVLTYLEVPKLTDEQNCQLKFDWLSTRLLCMTKIILKSCSY